LGTGEIRVSSIRIVYKHFEGTSKHRSLFFLYLKFKFTAQAPEIGLEKEDIFKLLTMQKKFKNRKGKSFLEPQTISQNHSLLPNHSM